MDDVDRLKRAALWYWEYMRRNPLYRKYCQEIKLYDDYFKRIGVYDFMQSKEFLNEMLKYVSSHNEKTELKYTPFRKRLERDHGEKAGRIFFKYGFLGNGFEKNFGRVYKDCNDGFDSELVLLKILRGENIAFFTENVRDIAAMVKLNGQWLISVDGFAPSTYSFDFECANEVKIDPVAILKNPEKVGLEVYAMNIINKAVESLFEQQRVPLETYESVYKLSLAGKHINSTDAMRLAMLWMWDKAHEHDMKEPLPFDHVYRLLKDRIEGADATDGVWEQILYRKPRIREYYASTERCIRQRIVIPLKSK